MPEPDDQSPERNPASRAFAGAAWAFAAVASALAAVVVIAWAVLDEVLFPLLRPLVAWLSGRRLFEAIGRLIGRLPPYVVLILLAVPFVLIEPLKVVALYWMATGMFVPGVLLLIGSYVLSILTLDRLYHTGKGQLLQIGWFAKLMGWIAGLRDWAFGWVKATAAWKWAARMARGARERLRSLARSA